MDRQLLSKLRRDCDKWRHGVPVYSRESRLAQTRLLDILTGGRMQGSMARTIPKTWSFREPSTHTQNCCLSPQFTRNKARGLSIHNSLLPLSVNEWVVPPQKASPRVRTILHCHWDDISEILIQMYHTKVSINSVGQEFLIQHSSADDSWDNYSKHKKGHRKIKACFSLKNTLYVHSSTYCTNCTGGLLALR